MEGKGPCDGAKNLEVNCEEEEEIPLEIEDYSCNTYFEETVMEIEHYITEQFRAHPVLNRLSNYDSDSSQTELESPVVLGRSFRVGQRGECGVFVEIHINDTAHAITRLFAVPFFFFARGTTTASSYTETESSFYLSLLTAAVGGAVRGGRIALRLHADPSPLTSPFFYASGALPCFVAVGDHYQLAFAGAAPPAFIVGKEKNGGKGLSLRKLIAQPILQTRFQCSAYLHPPEWCQSVGDYLDMFQLQVGTHSRVRDDVFDGICVSVQRTFCLKVPRRFPLRRSDPSVDAMGQPRVGDIIWHTILEMENETMLLSSGPSTFRFGTGTVPLRGIHFTFRWNQLHDTDIQEDSHRSSTLNPFSAVSQLLQKTLQIKARAIAKKECELSHSTCEVPSEYAYMVMEYIDAATTASSVWKQSSKASLEPLADEIMSGPALSISAQQALIDRIAQHHAGGRTGAAAADIRHVYFPGSLLCRFAYVCAARMDAAADVHALWLLLVHRLNELLEGRGDRRYSLQLLIDTIGIPVVDEIDHGLPLLVQKLQLLVYCAYCMLRDMQGATVQTSQDGWEDAASGEQKKYRAPHSPMTRAEDNANTATHAAPARPVRRLITNGEKMAEPPAIPLPPCTTDMIWRQAQALENLGMGGAAQNTRALVQSDRLLNDMCVFLYANKAHKGRVVRFPDFVQWHSPRDFVAKPQTSAGHDEKHADKENDDVYLSERMQRHSGDGSANVWWTLWSQATPRSPGEIIAQSFVPHAQARLIMLWLERDLSSTNLLLETINANLCNSLHRMLSHRCFSANSAMAKYALKKTEEIKTSVKDITLPFSLEGAAKHLTDTESVRALYSNAIRLMGEVETCLCATLVIERLLEQNAPEVNLPSDNELCITMEELVVALSSPSEERGDLTALSLRETGLTWEVWQRGGISQRFQAESQKPVEMRVRATCMAERPLSAVSGFQQMIVETDEAGIFRLAFALTEEVM